MLTLDPPPMSGVFYFFAGGFCLLQTPEDGFQGVRPRPVAGTQLVASLTALDGLRMKPGGHSPQLAVQAIWSSRRVPPYVRKRRLMNRR
jgi:hypothetical protein